MTAANRGRSVSPVHSLSMSSYPVPHPGTGGFHAHPCASRFPRRGGRRLRVFGRGYERGGTAAAPHPRRRLAAVLPRVLDGHPALHERPEARAVPPGRRGRRGRAQSGADPHHHRAEAQPRGGGPAPARDRGGRNGVRELPVDRRLACARAAARRPASAAGEGGAPARRDAAPHDDCGGGRQARGPPRGRVPPGASEEAPGRSPRDLPQPDHQGPGHARGHPGRDRFAARGARSAERAHPGSATLRGAGPLPAAPVHRGSPARARQRERARGRGRGQRPDGGRGHERRRRLLDRRRRDVRGGDQEFPGRLR